MDSKTSTIVNVFLSVSLICHLLATATACDTCPTLPNSGGSDQGQQKSTCPRNALKLGVCAKLLSGAVDVEVGNLRTTPCCTVLAGLVDLDLDAAICLCIAIRANVLGININVPVTLGPLLSNCGITLATNFVCA